MASERVLGQMMDFPLTLHHIFHKNETIWKKKKVVSYIDSSQKPFKYTYAEFQTRVKQLANVLVKLGVKRGDRVATFAFNHHQHLELYFAIPLIGAVVHTLNIRLFSDQLVYIINHAEDQIIFLDIPLLSSIESIASRLNTVRQYVLLGTEQQMHSVKTNLKPVAFYEDLMEVAPPTFNFPTDILESEASGLCYTSGTTGHPKGVLYSHRSTVIATFVLSMVDTHCISERDTVLPVVPMFHANAWGYPYACLMNGANMVLPGRDLSPNNISRLLIEENITFAADLKIVTGGSACPPSLMEGGINRLHKLMKAYEKEFGVQIIHAWGMSETSPLGTVGRLKRDMEYLDKDSKMKVRAKQGIPVAGLEMRLVDGDKIVPWDGKSVGEVQIRGPYIASSYYRNHEANSAFTKDGWFKTGDVATLDEDGYMTIVDRTKDLIKSGGEWISSVELETIIMAHPKVLEAAVVAIPHVKFQERPIAVVTPLKQHEHDITKDEIYKFLESRIAKWWLPDDIIFAEIPKTSVGKFDKKVLRARFETHKPSAKL